MQKLTAEAKVGIFVFLGLLLLVYMSLRVGGLTLGREPGYDLFVMMENAAGLDQDASVYIAGVQVGRVKKITLVNNKAQLDLRMQPEIKVGRDFIAALRSKGLLGEKYVELIPGSPDALLLADGDEIRNVERHQDIDKLINTLSSIADDVKEVTTTLSNVLGGDEGEATLRTIVNNIEDITTKLDRIVTANDERFNTTMKNFEEFSRTVKEVATTINEVVNENRGNVKDTIADFRSASRKLEDAMDKLNKLTPGIEDTIKSVKSVASKIDKGEGTIGKLINDPATADNINKTLSGINTYIDRAERFRTYVGYRGEYLLDPEETKHYVSIRIQPKADKYYLLEVVDDPRGKKQTTTVQPMPGTPAKTITTKEALKISAEFAKRFGWITVRGGIIESTGGAGIDINPLTDRIKLSLDAFDFNEERKPHLKAGAQIFLNRYFFVTGGIDDVLNKELRSSYGGIGFQFEDDDLKYLFSSSPPVKF